MFRLRLGKLSALLALTTGLGVIPSAHAGDNNLKTDARLVGSWVVSWVRTSGDKQHRLAHVESLDFSSSGTFIDTENWRTGSGSYAVTPSATARGIDVTTNTIGAKTTRGIYRFAGENLILCINAESTDARPTEFDLPPGSDRVLFVLQRSQVKHRKKEDAAKLVAEFKAHADEFEITIACHGGSSKIDLRSIMLHSSNRCFEPSAIGPSGKRVFKSARITKKQAIKLIDILEYWPAGFFRTSQDNGERLWEREPYFSTRIGYGPNSKQGPRLHLAQNWGWHTMAQLATIRDSMEGDAAKLVEEITGAIVSNSDRQMQVKAPAEAKQANTIKVLLVNGKPAADRFETATEYLLICRI